MTDVPRGRGPHPKNDPQRRLEKLVESVGTDVFPAIDEVTVEPWMIEELKKAEAGVRRLRRQLEARLAAGPARLCPRCRKPVIGRADRTYCSDGCRIAAHRRRHAPKVDPASLAPSLHGPEDEAVSNE